MDRTLDELQNAVLALAPAERGRLSIRILASLEQSPEMQAAWVLEVRNRLAALQRGKTEPSDTKTPRCDFCGKSQTAVAKLISGPAVYICNECVDLCNELLTAP
jgi:hypothetical protein